MLKEPKIQILALQTENFKSFSEPTIFPIRPLTLLFGPNSSGKSSFLKSLLLLKQTYENGRLDQLCPNGPLINLGTYEEFVFNHDKNKKLTFSFQINIKDIHRKIGSLQCAYGIDYLNYFEETDIAEEHKFSLTKELSHILNQYKTLTVSFSYSQSQPDESIKLDLIKFYLGDEKTSFLEWKLEWDKYIYRGAYSDFKHSFWKLYWEVFDKPNKNEFIIKQLKTECTLDGWHDENDEKVMEKFWERANKIKAVIKSKQRGFKQALKLYDLLLKGSSLSFERGLIMFNAQSDFWESIEDEGYFFSGPMTILRFVNDAIENFFQDFNYIGPLRAFPKRYYIFDENNSFASYSFENVEAPYQFFRDKNLLQEVNKELRKLHIPYEIKIAKFLNQNLNVESNILFSIDLFNVHTKRLDNLADVGFGFSQILPIIARCCLTINRPHYSTNSRNPQPETILIEQPELHLHPAMQTEIGDLFIRAATIDINEANQGSEEERFISPRIRNFLILETHSEHIILRILRRIRETTEEMLGKGFHISPNDVAVLYIKPGTNGSVVHHLPITDDGDFEFDWPDGFFEERDEELFF